MARRRTRAKEPDPVEAEEHARVHDDVPEPEPEPEPAAETEAEPAGDDRDQDDDMAQRSLEFDDELSWRPAKPIPSATLLDRLERLSKELADFDQGGVKLDSLKHVATSLAHRNLLQHKDRGVKAYTACCLVDILRLFVPEAPFTDDQLKAIFTLFIKDILPALFDPSNPYNSQHKYVLMSLSEVKSIMLLSEIHGADDLLLRLFNSAFDGVSTSSQASNEEQIAKDIEICLTDMLVEVIDESSGSIPATIIDAIISQFLRAAPPGGGRNKEQNGKQATLLHKTEPAAYVMAKNICNGCADKMSRYVSQYFSDVILNASRFATKSNGFRHGEESDEEDNHSGPSEADLKSLRQAHMLIRELWRAAPAILQNVVPQLDAELSADNVHLRLIATEAFGDMISGIGAAGPPPTPVLDPAAYPPLRLMDDAIGTPPVIDTETNALTRPYSPQSFAQTHHATYRNFVGRKNDKAGTIRAAWVTAAGYILSTSAGGIGLSREEETELIKGLVDKLNDSEEKVRLAAVKAIELFNFRDVILKLGVAGGVEKEGSIFASLADRCRDRKPAVRVDAMVLLGKLWAVGAGEIADGQEAVTACLSGVPTRIINAFYANDPDLNVLLDRVLFECLIPLKFPLVKGKGAKGASGSQGKGAVTAADQDKIRAERVLLMLKSLDVPAQKAFFAMQARQPQFAKGVGIFIQQCEAYNGGVIDANEDKVKTSLSKTFQWIGGFFPDPLKVRGDLQKFAKLNDRRSYQLVKYAIESESDFKTVRRAISELITKLQGTPAAVCLDTLIPLLYRSSCLMFNRSHLATIMDYSKSDKGGFAAVAHLVLNDISQRNPDIFKAHAEDLRREIIEHTPSDKKTNDPGVVDILKAYSSYAKKYPKDINHDRSFTQTLTSYALYASPPRAAKYAVNILLAKGDDKSKVTATNLLRSIMKGLEYGSPHFLARLASISQLERLAPSVTADSDEAIRDLTINQILRQVRTDATEKDPSWVDDADMNEELQAKCLALRILVNQALAAEKEPNAEDRVKAVFKLLKTFVVTEGEFCKVKDTPLHHRKRLRLLAGLLMLKLCTVKAYDERLEPPSFNKMAELVQDSELQVRRRFMEKLQNYLTRGKLRPRFHTILFLVAFEPASDLKNRVETWIRSRARYYEENKQKVMEALMGRLIPLLAHHPDFSAELDDLVDFANYFLFYLNTVATEDNISLIYRYTERVKQVQDGINPKASDNLYVLSDLASAVIRKYQERKNWIFQAHPDKVGIPSGLYTNLPSAEVAQQIAKKLYIPDEIDERLDDLLRAMDRKKVSSSSTSLANTQSAPAPAQRSKNTNGVNQKRKSLHEHGEPPAKRPRTQVKTVVREKSKAKTLPSKKSAKPKRDSKPKKQKEEESIVPSERRRSGRAHKVSDYKERADEDDEEEMLEGVAEWDYGEADSDGGGSESDESSELSDDDGAESVNQEAEGEEKEEAEAEAAEAPAKRKGSKVSSSPKGKASVKASVLAKLDRTSRTRGRGGRAARDDSEMEVDE
ncbi:Armadillo-type fold protein [Metarhizium album ARSEF 1941]|uniref:Armadillo-type fold protein n=1 Tax=Metarhizium album (strain ARSEF 1941) TaxID=1081103 RepID=A0A0B2WN41_METAS|nr:Armadillo-type fold protein [Metarhizium album ARSEF 1941]KHN95094.1 Armadillo-type fold protein [Metarhizium album ARSEF 1941]